MPLGRIECPLRKIICGYPRIAMWTDCLVARNPLVVFLMTIKIFVSVVAMSKSFAIERLE